MKNVTILTGFLGAGKTTFLNAILAHQKEKKFAIIENEFGEENIDNELIISTNDELIEMNNGCLCCTLNDNLYDLLAELAKRKDEFDELIIESTGIADPAEIAAPFLIKPSVKKEFKLKNIICLVDAEQIEHQLADTEEAIKQISFSQVIVLNKSDLVNEEQLNRLSVLIKNLNPFCEVIVGNKQNFPISAILSAAELEKKDESNKKELNHVHNHTEHHHKHDNHVHHHHGHINSISLRFEQPFDLNSLYHRLFQFLMFQGSNMYRIKGIIAAAEKDKKIILQSVGKRLNIEEGNAWQPDEVRQSKIVFIGKNLEVAPFQKLLYYCLAK